MSMDLFFTLQNQQSSSINAPSLPGGDGQAPVQIQGLNFIDLILARLTQNAAESDETNAGGTPKDGTGLLQSDNPTLAEDPTLNIAKILAANEDIAEQIGIDTETFSLDPQAQISEVLALNQQAFDDTLKPVIPQLAITKLNNAQQGGLKNILEGLITQGQENQSAIQGKLHSLMSHLKQLIAKESPSFIATNLTPEQITQLQEQIAGGAEQSGEDQPIFGGIFIGLVHFFQPQSTPEISAVAGQTPGGPTNNLATKLNNLVVGAGEEISLEEELGLEKLPGDKNFKNLIKQLSVGKNGAPIANGDSGAATAPGTGPGFSFLQGWPFSLTGSLLAPDGWSDPILQELGLLQSAGAHSGSAAGATSLIHHAQSAAHPHAASQMVAATIQKGATSGENKSMILQLDPPELGKVEIKLVFGSDKTVKASMVIEKPETFLMLQRDVHLLERTLQEIGLDSDGGLSFELAEHDHDFGQNGGHDGNDPQGGSGEAGAEGEEEIIETAMKWYVDPATGLTRYDLLA